MHQHSLKAYEEGMKSGFSNRELLILAFLHDHPTTFWTARQIGQKLGFSDLNGVKPRITRLLEVGAIVEGPAVKCEVTGKTVMTVAIPLADPKQLPLTLSA